MANIVIWVVVILVVVIGAIVLVVAGLGASRSDNDDDPIMTRLAEATQRGDVVSSLEQIEMQQPFSQRVVLPILRWVGEFSSRFTPQKALEDTAKKIELAGNPGRIDAATLLASRFVFAAVFGGGPASTCVSLSQLAFDPDFYRCGALYCFGIFLSAIAASKPY